MRRSMIAGVISLAAVLCVAITTPAHAKAQSFVDGVVKSFSQDKNNLIIEVRRCKDKSYDLIYYKRAENKVVMLKFRDKDSVVQTPLRTYDVELLKSLSGDVGKALRVFERSEPAVRTTPQLWGVSFEVQKGRPTFLVHCFTPLGETYKRSFPIDGKDWKQVTKDDEVTLSPNPIIAVPWSEEEKAAGNNDYPADLVGKGRVSSGPAVDSTAAASNTEAKTDKAAEADKGDAKVANGDTKDESGEAVSSKPNGGNGQGPRGRRNRANRNKQNQGAAE